jgi:ABC-type antimicrobial peptide transport system permease subunit
MFLGLVLRYGLRLAGIGAVIGIAIALFASRLVAGLLYGVSTTDPQTFALTILLLAVVAGVAIVVPARRATGVDPLTALREE